MSNYNWVATDVVAGGCSSIAHKLVRNSRAFVKNVFLRRISSRLEMMRNHDGTLRGVKDIEFEKFDHNGCEVSANLLSDGFNVTLKGFDRRFDSEFMYVGSLTDDRTEVLSEVAIGTLITMYQDMIRDIRCCQKDEFKKTVVPTKTGILEHDFTSIVYPTVFFVLLDGVHDQILRDWILTMDADKPEINPVASSYELATRNRRPIMCLEGKDALKLLRYTIARLTKVGIIYGKNFDPVNNKPSRVRGMLAATKLRKMWPALDTCGIEEIVDLIIGHSEDIILDVRPAISEKKELRIYNYKKKFWLNRYPNNIFKKKVVLNDGDGNDMTAELLVLRK